MDVVDVVRLPVRRKKNPLLVRYRNLVYNSERFVAYKRGSYR